MNFLGQKTDLGKGGTAFPSHILHPLPSSACSAWTPVRSTVNEGTPLQPLHQPWGPWLCSEQSKLPDRLFCSSVQIPQLKGIYFLISQPFDSTPHPSVHCQDCRGGAAHWGWTLQTSVLPLPSWWAQEWRSALNDCSASSPPSCPSLPVLQPWGG